MTDPLPVPMRHVLIVDDDPFSRMLLREMLRAAGRFHVSEAEDGHQALQRLDGRLEAPDLILCDLQMPAMDGIEFLRHLAARHYAGHLCLLSGTQRTVLEAAQRLASAQRLKVLGVLQKPVSERGLAGILAGLAAAHAQAADGEPQPARPAASALTPEQLREGIAQDRIELMFQPKVKVSERRAVGAECLARFRDERGLLLGPGSFVPMAEQHGLIDLLTVDVLRKAARQLAAWRGGPSFQLSINVSMLNLHQLDMPETFEAIVRDAGQAPEDFMLEITESALPPDYVVGLDILLRLRLKGFQLSLDDFGTGFSTMSSLGQLPFSELKLDQQFVQGALTDAKAMTILESSIRLGRALNLNLVAEGVETASEWALVEQLQCDEVQGYHVAKPMPAANMPAWLSGWHTR